MQTSHHVAAQIIPLASYLTSPRQDALSPAVMAQYLRETNPDSARCFAREMHDRVAWANEAWGAYWADVAELV